MGTLSTTVFLSLYSSFPFPFLFPFLFLFYLLLLSKMGKHRAFINTIPNGSNTWDVCFIIIVHWDLTKFIGFDPNIFKTQSIGVWSSSNRNQNHIGVHSFRLSILSGF